MPETKGTSPGGAAPQNSEFGALSLERIQDKGGAYEMVSRLPFSIRIGEQTAFDHTRKTVIIGTKQLSDIGISEPTIVDFIVLHELGHFKELADDPVGYKKVIDEGTRKDGLGKAYFRFYNALMDIYVNTNTRNKAPVFGGSEFSREVKECYREQLFKERDFTTMPLSTQYSYALLNMGMGIAADITVAPAVRAELDKQINLYGTQYTTQEIIDTFLVPAIGTRSSKEWQATISQRKTIIDETFRRSFERLVEKDVEEEEDPNQGSGTGDLEGVEASPEDFKKAIEEVERQIAEQNKSAAEKAAEERGKGVGKIAQKHLNPEEAQDFRETVERVQPTIIELVNLYQQIVRKEFDTKKTEQGFFKRGSSLDINRAVSQFGKIRDLPEESQVMMKDVYQEVVTYQPQQIRNWLSLDLSGSMNDDIGLLRELSVAFSGALQTLSMGAALGEHGLHGSLGIVGFNDNLIPILPLTRDPTYEHIAQSYKSLAASGGTAEHTALQKIVDEIKKDPPREGRVDIVIGITDGETNNPEKSKQLVKELEQLGVKLLAFRFTRGYVAPDVKPDPKQAAGEAANKLNEPPPPPPRTFGDIWGKHGAVVNQAQQVIPAVRRGLEDLLREM